MAPPDDARLRLRIASPCGVDWSSMSGDERSRFCGLCRKQVHDLRAMTKSEVDALLATVAVEGEACVRAWAREDGTLLLEEDCPIGEATRQRRTFRRTTAALGGLAAGIAALGTAALLPQEEEAPLAELRPLERLAPVATPGPAPCATSPLRDDPSLAAQLEARRRVLPDPNPTSPWRPVLMGVIRGVAPTGTHSP